MSLDNTTCFTTSLTLSSTYQKLSDLLAADGLSTATLDAQLDVPFLIRNEDASIIVSVASGYSTIPSGTICPVSPTNTIEFVAGMNLNECWVKGASGTPIITVAIGSTGYNITRLSGISTVSGSTNVLSKFDASDNLVDSTWTDDATTTTTSSTAITPTSNDLTALGSAALSFSDLFLASGAVVNYNNGNVVLTHTAGILTMGTGEMRITTVGTNTASVVTVGGTQTLTNKTLTSPVIATINSDLSVTGTIESADATTPILSTATGKTNTGYLSLTGKTSGSFKVLPADAMAQVVTMDIPAQTSGAATVSMVDFAGVNDTFAFVTKAQTLSNKTFVAPVLGAATGTSVAVTGLLTSSSPTAQVGYATGAGGAVEQDTSRTTAVTLNTNCGAITLFSAAGSTSPASFTVNNSAVAATDTIILSQKSGTDKYDLSVSAVGAGTFEITFNTKSGTTTEQPVINFSVISAVAA